MDFGSRLISQHALLFEGWPGIGFDGGRTGTAQWRRAWPELQERILKRPVLANWLVVLDKSVASSGVQASVQSHDEMA